MSLCLVGRQNGGEGGQKKDYSKGLGEQWWWLKWYRLNGYMYRFWSLLEPEFFTFFLLVVSPIVLRGNSAQIMASIR